MNPSLEIYSACRFCHDKASLLCSQCLKSSYCSQECKAKDWGRHQNWCKKDKTINRQKAERSHKECLQLIFPGILFKCLMYERYLNPMKDETKAMILITIHDQKRSEMMPLPPNCETIEWALEKKISKQTLEELNEEARASMVAKKVRGKIGFAVLHISKKVNIFVIGAFHIDKWGRQIALMPDELLEVIFKNYVASVSETLGREAKQKFLEIKKDVHETKKSPHEKGGYFDRLAIKPSQKNTRA